MKKRRTAAIFLAEIEAHLLKTKLSATTFGVQAVNDRNLVHDLRRGRVVNLDLYDKIKAFMAERK